MVASNPTLVVLRSSIKVYGWMWKATTYLDRLEHRGDELSRFRSGNAKRRRIAGLITRINDHSRSELHPLQAGCAVRRIKC